MLYGRSSPKNNDEVFMTLRNKSVLALGVVAVLGAFAIGHQQWSERFYYWYVTRDLAEDWRDKSVWLKDYRIVIEARALSGVSNNLSGLTYDPERGQLWGVINGPSELIGISTNGEVLSRHPLDDFHDVEGVAYLGNGTLAIVEERRQTIIVIPIPSEPGPLQRENFDELVLQLHQEDNKEYEGLAYDPARDRLYIAKERDPIRLYTLEGFARRDQQHFKLDIRDVTDSLGDHLVVRDLSGLAYDVTSGHVLALSDESRLLVELGQEGQIISVLPLVRGSGGLTADIPQAEGVTMDDKGRLYIVSEPNLFYRFEKPAPISP